MTLINIVALFVQVNISTLVVTLTTDPLPSGYVPTHLTKFYHFPLSLLSGIGLLAR